MKEPVLVILKPEGMAWHIVGDVLKKFDKTKLDIIATKIITPTREQAAIHYEHIQGRPFYKGLMNHFMGKIHGCKNLLAIIYYGEDAIKKCRKIAGATNPKEAKKGTIRGDFGKVRMGDLFENIVHVSSDKMEARREIKIWFTPDEISKSLYKTKKTRRQIDVREWI